MENYFDDFSPASGGFAPDPTATPPLDPAGGLPFPDWFPNKWRILDFTKGANVPHPPFLSFLSPFLPFFPLEVGPLKSS